MRSWRRSEGHVYQRGRTWGYVFDVDPDPLTGKRRQQTRGGFGSEREAWKGCRAAIKEYEDGHHVKPSKRKVEDAFSEWLKRIQHSVKPSMWASYRNYAQYYVVPYIGRRVVQDLDGATFDALYDHLLTNGRVKARPERRKPLEDKAAARERAIADRAAGKRRRGPAPKPRPLVPAPPPGLAPKTVVNTHRMLHKAWEDFVMWGWARRNVVRDAHVPRVPRRQPSTWNAEQLQRFLAHARGDRFFALWVLEATSGVRRSELAGARRDGINRVTGSLSFDITRVVVDGKVLESDGKTENAQRVVALDPLTLAVLHDWVLVLDAERQALGDAYHDHGLLFSWPDGRPHPTQTRSRLGSSDWSRRPDFR